MVLTLEPSANGLVNRKISKRRAHRVRPLKFSFTKCRSIRGCQVTASIPHMPRKRLETTPCSQYYAPQTSASRTASGGCGPTPESNSRTTSCTSSDWLGSIGHFSSRISNTRVSPSKSATIGTSPSSRTYPPCAIQARESGVFCIVVTTVLSTASSPSETVSSRQPKVIQQGRTSKQTITPSEVSPHKHPHETKTHQISTTTVSRTITTKPKAARVSDTHTKTRSTNAADSTNSPAPTRNSQSHTHSHTHSGQSHTTEKSKALKHVSTKSSRIFHRPSMTPPPVPQYSSTPPNQVHMLDQAQIIGISVAAVVSFVSLVAILLVCFLRRRDRKARKRRRKERPRSPHRGLPPMAFRIPKISTTLRTAKPPVVPTVSVTSPTSPAAASAPAPRPPPRPPREPPETYGRLHPVSQTGGAHANLQPIHVTTTLSVTNLAPSPNMNLRPPRPAMLSRSSSYGSISTASMDSRGQRRQSEAFDLE